MTTPVSLSVVVIAFNEVKYIENTMRALRMALERARIEPSHVVLVDDGSTDTTAEAARIAFGPGLKIIAQKNQGRFAARRVGVDNSSQDFVLLLDARSELEPSSLEFWCDQRTFHPDRLVWIAHTRTRTEGNPYAAFWEFLAGRVWPDYQGVLTSYGYDDFDRYPKGTTCLVAPRPGLKRAVAGRSASTRGPRDLKSDDTALLRDMIVDVGRFWISPDFAVLYTSSRATIGSFIRNAFYRGGTAIDGYAEQGGRLGIAARVLPAATLVSVPALIAALAFQPARTVVGGFVAVVFVTLGIAFMARRHGARWRESFAIGGLCVPFAVGFLPGMWRGWAHRLTRHQ